MFFFFLELCLFFVVLFGGGWLGVCYDDEYLLVVVSLWIICSFCRGNFVNDVYIDCLVEFNVMMFSECWRMF